jgi:hypothetical protein
MAALARHNKSEQASACSCFLHDFAELKLAFSVCPRKRGHKWPLYTVNRSRVYTLDNSQRENKQDTVITDIETDHRELTTVL